MSFQLKTGTVSQVGDEITISGSGRYEIETRGNWSGVLLLQKSADEDRIWLTKRAVISKNDRNISLAGTEPSECKLRIIAKEWQEGACDIVAQFVEE